MILDMNSYREMLDNLYDGMYFIDRDRVIRYWNKAAEKISGFTAAEVIGKSCADSILTHVDEAGNNLCKGQCPVAMTIADGEPRETEIYLHHKAGHRVLVSARITPLTDSRGMVIGGLELFTDMSSFKSFGLRIKELEEMALIDSLTRLPNRNCLEKEIFVRLEEHKRFGVPFGILFMDIDEFKGFNDHYGHDVGDRTLKFVAETLVKNSRPFDLLGRWGGDEFIGIIRNVTEAQLEQIGNRLRVLVENSYILLEDQQLHVSISIGGTLVREADRRDTILKRADTLLYKSKGMGRNRLIMG